jgi:hypothetical protein
MYKNFKKDMAYQFNQNKQYQLFAFHKVKFVFHLKLDVHHKNLGAAETQKLIQAFVSHREWRQWSFSRRQLFSWRGKSQKTPRNQFFH